MGTSGYISFIAGSQAKNAYSHYDSGPDDLGLTMLHWIRAASASPESLRTAISGLKVVSDDDGEPAVEEVGRLRRYSDPSVGDPATVPCSGGRREPGRDPGMRLRRLRRRAVRMEL